MAFPLMTFWSIWKFQTFDKVWKKNKSYVIIDATLKCYMDAPQ